MSPAGWIAIIVLVLCVYGFIQLGRRREITEEEFEREARRASLIRTGLQELQGFLEPAKRAAQEAVQEEKRKTNTSVAGEPPEPGSRIDGGENGC
jgi:hypothetical protein